MQHRQPNSLFCSALTQPELDSYLGTDPGEENRHAVGCSAWDFKPHNSSILRAHRLKTAVPEARPEGTVGATEAGLVQGQDGPLITALLHGVVDLIPVPGCWLAYPQSILWTSQSRMGSKDQSRTFGPSHSDPQCHLLPAPCTYAHL